MPLLLVKLLATPVLIGGVSLVARRWGPALAGWLVALPLTSGPVVVYVAVLEHGVPLGLDVGLAVVSGGFGLCAYAIVYARSASRLGALWSWLGDGRVPGLRAGGRPDRSAVARAGSRSAWAWRCWRRSSWCLPRRPSAARAGRQRWDLPARVIVGTTIVVGLSAFAPVLGARVSGLAATYPVYVSTLTVFAHRQDGPGAATALLRGLVLGLYGWLGFFVILLVTMPLVGALPAFVTATSGRPRDPGGLARTLRDSLTPGVREAVVNESVP